MTKLMLIIFALAGFPVYVASSQSAPLICSLPLTQPFGPARLSRSIPIGSIHHGLE